MFTRLKNLWRLSELEIPKAAESTSATQKETIVSYFTKPKKATFIKREIKTPIESFLEEAHKDEV